MAIETNELIDVQSLPPFKKFIMSIGAIPTSYLDSMSYAELLAWFCNYLQTTVIPTVNNNGEAVEELQDFVSNYFNNLDVQEEINQKLDQMAEDGTLTNLIKDYVDPIYQAYEERINSDITSQNNEIDSFEDSVNTRINSINDMVATLSSGSPNGVYDTLADLQSANPDHQYIYVVVADGNWYYYDDTASAWTSGGTYQNIALTTNSIKKTMIDSNVVDCEIGKNKFNKETINEGYFITPSTGVINNNASYFTSDFIKIDNTQDYYLSHLYQQQVFVNYYANDYTRISGEIVTQDGQLTIPSNASVLNLGTLISKKDTLMLEIGTKATAYENYKYVPNGIVTNITEESTTFINNTSNLIDVDDLLLGHFIRYTDGALVDNANYYATPFIAVKPNTTYSLNKHTNFQVAFFNGSYQYLSGTYYVESTNGQFTTPANCYYLRFGNRRDEIENLMFVEGSTIPTKYIPYGYTSDIYIDENNILHNIFYVGSNERFTKLKDGIEEAIKYKNSILYVKQGTYNLYNEFGGSTFFDSYDETSSVGLILENDIHVIFDSNSKVVFNYDGSNSVVVARFSPFNSNPANNTGGFTIENATIECTNCRYCFHDEKYATTSAYKSHYKNCSFNITMPNQTNIYEHLGIGMGLGKSGEIIIQDCYFNTGLLIHNNGSQSDTSSKSNVIIKNNVLEHNTIYLEHCGASTLITTMLVSNNKTDSNIVVRQNESSYIRDNINVIEWNNIHN